MEKQFWQEDDDYYKLEPLTALIVEKAETNLGLKFPEVYIELLKVQNGGYIHFDSYSLNSNEIVHIDHIMGIGMDKGIMQSHYLIKEWGLPEDVVLFSGEGHSWIAFDYREVKENPPIIYIDVESERILQLAPNFATFIDGLFVQEVNSTDKEPWYHLEAREWNSEELRTALSSGIEYEVGQALDYLYELPKGKETFIAHSLVGLLKSSVLEIKQLAANYAYHFDEAGVLSSLVVDEIIDVLKKDRELDYYVEMFFEDRMDS